MSTLNVVEHVLRQRHAPVSVREIVELAGTALPTKSKTPDTVVARDLAMDIKRHGSESKFARVSPGRYTLREFVTECPQPTAQGSAVPLSTTSSAVLATSPVPTPHDHTEI